MMALAFAYNLQNLWPLSILKFDDLKESERLVRKLSIPESTKRFVYAVRDRESQSVIYILCAENLSERSAVDAECLIREIRPDAVVAQVGNLGSSEIQLGMNELDDYGKDPVPTSSFGVLKRCFVEKITKEKYENLAAKFVLREIFGTGLYEHVLIAKNVAREVGSSFLLIEAPESVAASVTDDFSNEINAGSKVNGAISGLVPNKVGLTVSSRLRTFCLNDDVQIRMVKFLSLSMDASLQKLSHLSSVSEAESKELEPFDSFQVPTFASTFYPLLVDLHNIFNDLPSIGTALAFAQRMLHNVSRGEAVDTRIVSQVYAFRIAVEGLRIALNEAGRLPIPRLRKLEKAKIEFSELPVQDKGHALLAQALKSQTKKFKTVVAVVHARGLAGLRRHWNTPVPPEVMDMIEQHVYESDGEASDNTCKKWLFSNKPVVAVGAGATAVVGASSLCKVVPASTFMKVATLKIPASVKLLLLQTKRTMGIAMGKSLLPSEVLARVPGVVNSGASATSVLKTAASAEKIRMVAHSIIASMEKTSFSAMRTAFYEIMRKRRLQPVGILPWVTFGCSITTCSGLFICGDGIECAAESFPAAPSIASLGRGIQSLHQASQIAGQKDASKIQKSIDLLMQRLRKVKAQ
ncbi:hypothetical protein K2173_018111 [Erythroxylum novogranatense]|uniref:Transmembrane protein n=1 Tax=Erythroxylum novogranatense TaxID=1862640 RepID=A0AAV8U6A7_9ROSI|nr:hypothetical protein K2173_018111 [Erythroxylum novogranatense]